MKTILGAELYKLRRSKCLWVLTFFSFTLLLILVKQSRFSVNDIRFWTENNFFQMSSVLIALYGIVIAHEYISGYFLEASCAGYRRWEVYLVRYFAFLFGTMSIILLPCLFCLLFSFLGEETGIALLVAQGNNFLVGFGFLILYCICISAFFMMLTMLTKTYSMIVFICIFYNMLIVMLHEMIPEETLPCWVQHSIVGMRQTHFFQVMEIRERFSIFFSLFSQGILYTGIGICCFAKQELR